MKPLARKEKLTIQELSEETLVFDLNQNKLHCLNGTSALVWKHCDGQHDSAALAALVAEAFALPADESEAATQLALEQLGRRQLLQQPVMPVTEKARLTRRAALRKMATAAAAALPVVMTLRSPSVVWGAGGHQAQFDTGCGSIGGKQCAADEECQRSTKRFGTHTSQFAFDGTCVKKQQTPTSTPTPTNVCSGRTCDPSGNGCPSGCRCQGNDPFNPPGVGTNGTCVQA